MADSLIRSASASKLLEDEDTADLSPPPSESMSPPSSVLVNPLEDEIVVGARTAANGAVDKSSPLQVVSDREDETMADVEDEQPVSHYPKRKRTISSYNDLTSEKLENAAAEEPEPTRATPKAAVRKPGTGVKGVVLGYWRDSKVPDPKDRHSVIGFIDVRDRLRTRIQTTTRSGEPIGQDYPLPPGPGGSWVTFERIVFDDLLVGMDQHQVKEFVKLRADIHESTEEEKQAAMEAAKEKAIEHVRNNPAPDTAPPAARAYGAQIPEDHLTARQDATNKRRRTSGGFATINQATPTAIVPVQEPVPLAPAPGSSKPLDPLHGTRPTRILIGFWKGSSEVNVKDRHAVYGILGQNDMFRVKVVRETRDGRFVDGNFPSGAGALWIHYDEVEREPHLRNLNRNEIKEYCRVRQRQIDDGEEPNERLANETKAVYEAQTRVAQGFRGGNNAIAPRSSIGGSSALDLDQNDYNGHELRQSRRIEAAAEAGDHQELLPKPSRMSLGNDEFIQGSAQPSPVAIRPSRRDSDMVERTTNIARREIARAEQNQLRSERYTTNRDMAAAASASAAGAHMSAPQPPTQPQGQVPAGGPPNKNGTRIRFGESEDLQRLNNVWARQEAQRFKTGAEDAKMYGGIKYERKQSGPFQGRFVSQGSIITIDGDDYVEYRVLTKPSFF